MAARATVAVLEGRGLRSTEMGELIDLLRHTGEYVKEQLIDPLFDHEDESRQ